MLFKVENITLTQPHPKQGCKAMSQPTRQILVAASQTCYQLSPHRLIAFKMSCREMLVLWGDILFKNLLDDKPLLYVLAEIMAMVWGCRLKRVMVGF